MLPCGGGRSCSGVIANVIESSGQSANRGPASAGRAQAPFEGGDRQRLNAFRTGRGGSRARVAAKSPAARPAPRRSSQA